MNVLGRILEKEYVKTYTNESDSYSAYTLCSEVCYFLRRMGGRSLLLLYFVLSGGLGSSMKVAVVV